MKEELKSCPFCGGGARSDFTFVGRAEITVFYIECTDCNAEGGEFNNKSDAIKAWNTRV